MITLSRWMLLFSGLCPFWYAGTWAIALLIAPLDAIETYPEVWGAGVIMCVATIIGLLCWGPIFWAISDRVIPHFVKVHRRNTEALK